MAIIKQDLYDTNAALYVLSGLMHKPLLLQDDKYAFVKTDFYKQLQQIIFYAIYNMAQNGMENICPADVDLYLKQYSSLYEYYKANKGYEYLLQCFQAAETNDGSQFDYYYYRLKKFSLLRDLEAIGYNVSEFYDTNKNALNRDLEDEKLNKMKLQEIPDRIRSLLIEIENKHIGKNNGTTQVAGKGLRQLVAKLQECPEVGLPLEGELVNSATRGARLGKLYTYSAPTGSGKTRYMLGSACAISMPYINERGQVVLRGDETIGGSYQKALFVTTEQQADEIQTMILAYVSGVNEKKILLGNYTADEEKRIQQALDIVEKYQDNLLIECIPDPSIGFLKTRLSKFIVQDQVNYIFYDYIFSSPSLLGEFKDVGVREDVALMMLSNTLKEIAANYNVFIQSATQLNENYSKIETGFRDQNCLRGSKAIADKIDCGMIGVRISEEEYKQINTMCDELMNQGRITKKPNVVIDVYKNRRGDLNAVKIFRYFNFGTCHAEDLFISDVSYKSVADLTILKHEQKLFDFLELKSRGMV